jgi:hypothetical protein
MARRLIDLNPTFQCTVDDPRLYLLSFDCPLCGAPWRTTIKARLGGPAGPAGIWAWTASPFGNVPPVPLDWNTVTVAPSVRCEGFSAHGRKRECTAHFTIADGMVQAA